MMRLCTSAVFGIVALAVGLTSGCGESHAAAPVPVPLEDHNDGFWWTSMGEQSAAVANFGPSFELRDGLYRQWSLVIHLPGTPEPLSCLQGVIDLSGAAPIRAEGDLFTVEIQPHDGSRWGDVRADSDLATTVDGIY